MAKLPPARDGIPVSIRGRPLDFSMWPVTTRKGAGATLNSRLFAADPWPVMTQAANELATKDDRRAARAFIEQGQDFYRAASSASTAAAKPLLLYYAFLNIAKALILNRIPKTNLDGARHGVGEKLQPGGRELTGAYLETQNGSNRPLVFELLHRAITGNTIAAGSTFGITTIMRQIVAGHRLFLAATGKSSENFLAPTRIRLLHHAETHTIWIRIEIAAGDVSRLGLGQARLLQLSRFAPLWRSVRVPPELSEIWLEEATPAPYAKGWISDGVMPLINSTRHRIWQAVLAVPPYRAYYLFVPPSAELGFVLPQVLSAYALIFYFGSITRYRPHHFDRILEGPYGAFVESFLQDQPSQLLFLFASEFARREVSKAALV